MRRQYYIQFSEQGIFLDERAGHKSNLISLSKVEMIEGNQVRIGDKFVPIGSNYKMEFEKLVKAE